MAGEHQSAGANLCEYLLPVVIPGMLQGKAGSAVAPMLPIFVSQDLHGSHTAVGIVASAYGLAAVVNSAWLGILLRRCHYTVAGIISLACLVCTALTSYFAPSVAAIFAIRFVGGTGSVAYDLSRKTFMACEVPDAIRGRVSALLAGMQKIALMVGALIGGFVAHYTTTRGIFLVQASFSGAALLVTLFHEVCRKTAPGGSQAEPSSQAQKVEQPAKSSPPRRRLSLRSVARAHCRDLIGAGGYCSLLVGLRFTWSMLLPLTSASAGLEKQYIGLVVAMARGLDAFGTLTITGRLLDTFGCKPICAVANALMGLGFFSLAFATDFYTILAAASIYSFGNSLSAGVVNYFATALAPAHARTEFLGLWKTVTAVGQFAMPPLCGMVADATGSLGRAATLTAGVAFLMVVWLVVMVRDGKPSESTLEEPLKGAAAA